MKSPTNASVITIISKNGTDGPSYTWRNEDCLIGRSSDSQIIVNAETVAPHHCMLSFCEDGQVKLTDLSQKENQPEVKETLVNNIPIVEQTTILPNHSIIEVGGRRLRFSYGQKSPWFNETSNAQDKKQQEVEQQNKSIIEQAKENQETINKTTPQFLKKSLITPSRIAKASTPFFTSRKAQFAATPSPTSMIMRTPTSDHLMKTVFYTASPSTPSNRRRALGTRERYGPTPRRPPSVQPNIRVFRTNQRGKIMNKTTEMFFTPMDNLNKYRKRKLPEGIIMQELTPQSLQRKQVSFGPQLSPEQFDKTLPPATPLKRGGKWPRPSTDGAPSRTSLRISRRLSDELVTSTITSSTTITTGQQTQQQETTTTTTQVKSWAAIVSSNLPKVGVVLNTNNNVLPTTSSIGTIQKVKQTAIQLIKNEDNSKLANLPLTPRRKYGHALTTGHALSPDPIVIKKKSPLNTKTQISTTITTSPVMSFPSDDVEVVDIDETMDHSRLEKSGYEYTECNTSIVSLQSGKVSSSSTPSVGRRKSSSQRSSIVKKNSISSAEEIISVNEVKQEIKPLEEEKVLEEILEAEKVMEIEQLETFKNKKLEEEEILIPSPIFKKETPNENSLHRSVVQQTSMHLLETPEPIKSRASSLSSPPPPPLPTPKPTRQLRARKPANVPILPMVENNTTTRSTRSKKPPVVKTPRGVKRLSRASLAASTILQRSLKTQKSKKKSKPEVDQVKVSDLSIVVAASSSTPNLEKKARGNKTRGRGKREPVSQLSSVIVLSSDEKPIRTNRRNKTSTKPVQETIIEEHNITNLTTTSTRTTRRKKADVVPKTTTAPVVEEEKNEAPKRTRKRTATQVSPPATEIAIMKPPRAKRTKAEKPVVEKVTKETEELKKKPAPRTRKRKAVGMEEESLNESQIVTRSLRRKAI